MKQTFFCRFLLSLGGFRNLATRLSIDPHLKILQGVRSVRCLSESPAARDFSLILFNPLKTKYSKWLAPPKKVHFSEQVLLSHNFYQNLKCYQDLNNLSVDM